MSFWQHVEALPDVAVSERDLAPALGELHRALASYPGELPVLAGPAHDVPRCLAALSCDPGLLDAARGAVLHEVHDRLRPTLERPPRPWQPLHGDVFPGNVIATRDGLLRSDFEDTCLGPTAWDVANLRPDRSDRRAVDDYPDPPSDEELDVLVELRTLHVVAWMAAAPLPRGAVAVDVASFVTGLMGRWGT